MLVYLIYVICFILYWLIGLHLDKKDQDYQLWKNSEAYNQAYLNKICNKIKNCPDEAIYTILWHDENWSNNCCCKFHKERIVDNNCKYVRYIPPHLKILL